MTYARPTAESRCRCGSVKLRFLRPTPVVHVHCCCISCRQGREWVASQGGPPMTGGPTMVYYFENDLAPLEPDAWARLYAVKLREGGCTNRLVTTCCHSAIALDHPFYDGNVVCVHADTCDLTTPPVPPLRRLYTADWDVVCDGEMPAATAALEDSDAMREKFAGLIKRPRAGATGFTLQDILARLPPPVILGLPENVRGARAGDAS